MSDPNTIVTSAQTVSDVMPYIQGVFGVIISAIGGIVAVLVKKYVGISVSQDMLDKIEGLAAQYAAVEVAKATDNLATKQIDVGSPMVKAIYDKIATDAPKELTALGLGPDAVKSKIAAEFGKLQASMTATILATPSQTGGLGMQK